MPWNSLPSRNLARVELEALVERIGQASECWRDEIAYSDDRRHFVELYRDEYVDVWLLCWTHANDTGWHDHDISSGAVRVVQGTLIESCPRIGGQHATREVPAGCTFSFGPEHIHRIAGKHARAVSIHAYSPPLWRLGQYAISDDGVMSRVSVSYAEELRPLEAPLAA